MTSPTVSYIAIVAAVLVLRRELAGLSQTEVATCCGVKQSQWSKIERGASVVSCEQLTRVASVLKTTPGAIAAHSDPSAAPAVYEAP